MKKFLFTLAALLMAGSAFAANVYIADREFTADEIGTQVWLDVMVQLDNEYINGWDFSFEFPENLTVTSSIKKNNAVLKQTAVTNEFGDEEDVSFTVNGDAYHTAAFCAQAGYWDPDGDEEYEMYGAVKIGPTGEFMLYQIRVTPTEAFTGGNIVITWMVSGGFDNRNGQTKVQVEGTTTVALTVEGGSEPEKTETPVITYDEDTFTVTATGAGEVKLYVNGEEVENPYTFELGEEETTYTVTATAQEEGKEISETATLEVTVPAAPVVIEVTPKPIIDVFDDPEAQTVTVKATGYGHIIIYWDDMPQAEGDGEAVWVIPYGDDPEGEEYGVSATAQEEGKEVSEYALATIFVPGKPSSEQTQTPSGSYQVVHGKLEVIVTITPYEGDVFYRIIHTAPDGTITESDWMPYVDAFSLYEDGRYRVEFYAVAEGKLPSEIGVLVFTISPMAGIEEMTTDKSVASVRYFNMAGQEMQLPNGMTIIVTTYTDGTSSAIKVMK